jgi:hypothetical protein
LTLLHQAHFPSQRDPHTADPHTCRFVPTGQRATPAPASASHARWARSASLAACRRVAAASTVSRVCAVSARRAMHALVRVFCQPSAAVAPLLPPARMRAAPVPRDTRAHPAQHRPRHVVMACTQTPARRYALLAQPATSATRRYQHPSPVCQALTQAPWHTCAQCAPLAPSALTPLRFARAAPAVAMRATPATTACPALQDICATPPSPSWCLVPPVASLQPSPANARTAPQGRTQIRWPPVPARRARLVVAARLEVNLPWNAAQASLPPLRPTRASLAPRVLLQI